MFVMGHYGLRKAYLKEEYEKILAGLASTDPLTGLYNRRAILNILEKKLRADVPGRHHLLFLDIDYFKQVNDSLGHNAGDEVIRHVCKQVASCIRKSDAIGRLGGDEILVLLDSVGTKVNAFDIAEKILRKCREKLHTNNFHVSITVSIGIATSGKCRSASEWIDCADGALYKAKQSGRNCVRSNDDKIEGSDGQIFTA